MQRYEDRRDQDVGTTGGLVWREECERAVEKWREMNKCQATDGLSSKL